MKLREQEHAKVQIVNDKRILSRERLQSRKTERKIVNNYNALLYNYSCNLRAISI